MLSVLSPNTKISCQEYSNSKQVSKPHQAAKMPRVIYKKKKDLF